MERGRGGYTLAEILAVLAITGILAALAAPALQGMIARAQVRAALNQLTVDLWNARAMAVRSGSRVEVVFLDPGSCTTRARNRVAATAYEVAVRDPVRRVLRRTELRDLGPGVCLESNNGATLVFGSRGLPVPYQNRTVWARKGAMADSMAVSVLGRMRRM